jgi:hypothetical protein
MVAGIIQYPLATPSKTTTNPPHQKFYGFRVESEGSQEEKI